MASSGSTPGADILASIEEQILFCWSVSSLLLSKIHVEISSDRHSNHLYLYSQADAISLNTVTKSYEQAGVGDFKLLKLETEFVKGYFLALQGSKKLNIKSRYRSES